MIPPAGFKAELYPLRHRFSYRFGLSADTTAVTQHTIMTLVKHYKGVGDPSSIIVNPHDPEFEVETGAICGPMSIIDKLKMHLKIGLTKTGYATDNHPVIRAWWMPIFFSFPEKLDAADQKSTTTVKAILKLTSDATQEDVTPAFAVKLPVDGPSELAHPVTSANMNEVFGTLNLTTNTAMEAVPFDRAVFFKALKYYTNKGALKACIGQTRNFNLTATKPFQDFFINKFVPKAIRRIVPYTYFGIIVGVENYTKVDQTFMNYSPTASKATIGVTLTCTYDEWNPEHNQDNTS